MAWRLASPGLLVTILVLALVLPPIWTLLRSSLMPAQAGSSGVTFQYYGQLFAGQRLASMAMNSCVFAACATLVSLCFGGVLAWIVERTNAPLKGLAYLTTIISLGTPYILYVTAWLFLLGRSGPLNDLYKLIDPSATLFNVNGLIGMILIEGFLWSPLVFLMMSATFRATNAEMEEAARMAGASVAETVRRVSLRLASPAILAVALFVFIRNLESFEVPVLVGMPGRVDILTTEIYRSVKGMPPQLGYASAFSVVMLLVVSVLLYLYARISRRAEEYAGITGKGYRPRPFQLGRARWLGSTIILLNFLIVLGMPLLAVVWMAILPFVRPMRLSGLRLVTAQNFEVVLGSQYYLGLAVNTVLVAGATATFVTLLTGFAGWLAARGQRFGALLDQLITLPLVFPGLVLGVALLEVALQFPIQIYGTLWLIGLAFVVRYMPYGMRYAYAGVLQIHRDLEHAAGVAGADAGQTLRRIVVPLLWPALASGWLFVFLIASKEMSVPLILSGPDSQTIAVALFDLWSNGQVGEAAALGLLWTVVMAACASVLYVLMRRRSAVTFGR